MIKLLPLGLALCLLSQAHLRAETSVLDTAPGGGKPDTNAPSAVAPVVPPPDPGTALLSNGDLKACTQDPSWPDDWAGAKFPSTSYQTENGQPYFHLVSERPEQHIQARRVIDLPPGVTALEITARYRVIGLKRGQFPEDDARIILEFLDKVRKPIAAAPPIVFAEDASGWTTISARIAVPEKAEHLMLMPCLYRVQAGTLDVAEIQVKTLGDPEAKATVEAAAAATAKKIAGETALLEKDLAMPPISPEIHVSGNKLVTVEGKEVWLQGLNLGNFSIRPDEGHKILWSAHVAIDVWKANVIRLTVLDSFWFGRGRGTTNSNDSESYRLICDQVIKIAAAKGAYVVFDLHRYLTPDESCVTFWKDAAVRYKNNPAVLFDIINEPHDTSWEVWQKGGPVELKNKDGTKKIVQGVGMQTLIDTVRAAGAKNIIVAGGLGYAYDLTGVVKGHALDDKGGNGIMYATHFYNWHKGWEAHFMEVAAKYPLLVGECGADIDKMDFIPLDQQEDPYTWVPDAIGFIQKNHLNWTAWCFHTRATPNMLLDWDYHTPTPYWGAFVKDALNGKTYEMKKTR